MTDTNTLRPGTSNTLEWIERNYPALTEDVSHLRAELLRLADDCARLVDCINAQPPTRRSLIDRAEHAEAELAAMRARIEGAAVGTLDICYNGHEPAFIGFPQPFEHDSNQDLIGKRVRLVREDGDA